MVSPRNARRLTRGESLWQEVLPEHVATPCRSFARLPARATDYQDVEHFLIASPVDVEDEVYKLQQHQEEQWWLDNKKPQRRKRLFGRQRKTLLKFSAHLPVKHKRACRAPLRVQQTHKEEALVALQEALQIARQLSDKDLDVIANTSCLQRAFSAWAMTMRANWQAEDKLDNDEQNSRTGSDAGDASDVVDSLAKLHSKIQEAVKAKDFVKAHHIQRQEQQFLMQLKEPAEEPEPLGPEQVRINTAYGSDRDMSAEGDMHAWIDDLADRRLPDCPPVAAQTAFERECQKCASRLAQHGRDNSIEPQSLENLCRRLLEVQQGLQHDAEKVVDARIVGGLGSQFVESNMAHTISRHFAHEPTEEKAAQEEKKEKQEKLKLGKKKKRNVGQDMFGMRPAYPRQCVRTKDSISETSLQRDDCETLVRDATPNGAQSNAAHSSPSARRKRAAEERDQPLEWRDFSVQHGAWLLGGKEWGHGAACSMQLAPSLPSKTPPTTGLTCDSGSSKQSFLKDAGTPEHWATWDPGWDPNIRCGKYSAEERLKFLMNNTFKRRSERDAKAQVMSEFSFEFYGECAVGWQPEAVCAGIKAKDRALWLSEQSDLPLLWAQMQVMNEYWIQFHDEPTPGWIPEVMCEGHSAQDHSMWLAAEYKRPLSWAREEVMHKYPEKFVD